MRVPALQTTAASGQYRVVPIGAVYESRYNPRKTFDPKALEDLAASIRAKGILTPLLARPRAEAAATYELAAGHRRFRAAKLAGLTELPLVVREMDDDDFLEVLTVENLQREDVNPLEEADGYRLLLDTWRGARKGENPKLKADVEKLAARVGKSTSYVYQRLKLQELSDIGRERLQAGELTCGHAILIARLSPAQQNEALNACRQVSWRGQDQVMSVRELGEWIDTHIHLNLSKIGFSKTAPDLVPEAGPCTTCPKRTGNAPEFAGEAPDRCTDRTCYEAKVAAFIANSSTAVRLSSNYGRAGKGVLSAEKFRVIDKFTRDCSHSLEGLYVEGAEAGQVVKVCLKAGCLTHHPKLSNSHAAQERENQKRAKAESAVRLAILEALLSRLESASPATALVAVPRELLNLVVEQYWRCSWREARDRVAPLLGLNKEDASDRDLAAGGYSDEGVLKVLVCLAVATELHVSQHSTIHTKPPLLLRAAALYGLDVAKVRACAKQKLSGLPRKASKSLKPAVQTSAPKRRKGA